MTPSQPAAAQTSAAGPRAGRRPGPGRAFTLLQTASFCGGMATRCLEIAVAWWVLDQTGNETLLGLVLGAGIAADVLARGALGWIGDRFPAQRVITCCFVGSAVISGVLAGLAFAGVYNLALVLVGVILLGLCLGLREPLLMSSIRSVVDTSSVAGAVRIRSAMNSLSSFSGPVAAGALIGPLGYSAVLAVACGVVAVCAALVTMLRIPYAPKSRQQSSGVASWAAEAAAGFRAIRHVVPEWRLAMLAMVVDFALFPVFAVVVPALVASHFPGHTWVLSIVESAFAVGMILGSAVFVRWTNTALGRHHTVPFGFAALGAGFVGTGAAVILTDADSPFLFTAVASMLLMLSGVGLCMVTVNTGTVRLLATPEAFRNRMVAAASFLSGIVMPIGSLASGLLSRTSGEWFALVSLGGIICLCAGVAWADRAITRFLRMPDDVLEDAYLREFPHAFGTAVPHTEKTPL
ncbi:MFS transporter [Streptomyces luteogriseus]|uniref:MFS transporter n=1 Tax=Streptomyces luteogriseus TaxID=68233 RepID=UPI0033CBA238